MALFQGLFLLVIGLLLMLVTLQSLAQGWLPFGANGFGGRLEIHKAANPTGFWAVFCLYAAASTAVTVYALLILTGVLPPLPLRGRTAI